LVILAAFGFGEMPPDFMPPDYSHRFLICVFWLAPVLCFMAALVRVGGWAWLDTMKMAEFMSRILPDLERLESHSRKQTMLAQISAED
jgi:hypothetical protein